MTFAFFFFMIEMLLHQHHVTKQFFDNASCEIQTSLTTFHFTCLWRNSTFFWFNVGISNTQDIQTHVKKAIEGKYTLYNLGFGYGVDYNFLEKMALENKGLARRIYPDSDSALQLQVQ